MSVERELELIYRKLGTEKPSLLDVEIAYIEQIRKKVKTIDKLAKLLGYNRRTLLRRLAMIKSMKK